MHRPLVIAALLGAALAQNQAQNQNQGDAHACARRCTDALNGCRSQPGANQATCQTEYASCLGYNPGTGVTATACANNGGGGSPAGSAANQPGGGQPDECAKKCTDAYNGCRTQSGANQATCRASFASCLGYNPPDDTPTSCQGQGQGQGGSAWTSSQPATPTAAGAGAVGQEDCLARCNAAMDSCRTQPNANQSFCSSQYASCLGYNPYQNGGFVTPTACSGSASGVAPTGTVPVVAGGSQLSPAYAAMAIGLLALL